MSNKYYKGKAEIGLSATHHSLGDVTLIGRVEHDGDCVIWVVRCWEKDCELRLVDEDSLSDFYYYGD